MKKSLVVTGAASLALAAMPLAGVFADNPPYTKNTVTDILNVRVPDSCSLSATNGSGGVVTPETVNTISTLQDYTVTYYTAQTADAISNGQTKDYTATTIKVICNDASGWMVNAIGASQTGQGVAGSTSTINSMAPTLSTSHPIVTGTSGESSYWAMKLTTPTGTVQNPISYPAVVMNDFQDWHAVPNASTKVAYGPMTDTTVSNETGHVGEISGDGSEFTTNYQVHIGATQEADTYTGKVTYTLVHPNDGNNS